MAPATDLSRKDPPVDSTDQPNKGYVDHGILTTGVALIDTIVDAAPPQPFFFVVEFEQPRLGFYGPKQYWDLYDRNDFPLATFKTAPVEAREGTTKMLANNRELLNYEPNKTNERSTFILATAMSASGRILDGSFALQRLLWASLSPVALSGESLLRWLEVHRIAHRLE
jgi:hypothetical protein